jgi:hypothetical protein
MANAEGQLAFSFVPDRIHQPAGSYKTALFDPALKKAASIYAGPTGMTSDKYQDIAGKTR